jgi:hypothetical protein
MTQNYLPVPAKPSGNAVNFRGLFGRKKHVKNTVFFESEGKKVLFLRSSFFEVPAGICDSFKIGGLSMYTQGLLSFRR